TEPVESSTSPTRIAGRSRGFTSPTRLHRRSEDAPTSPRLQRYASAASGRGSNRVPSLAPETSLAQRTQGLFTTAGPDDTSNLRQSQEPFVQPGYGELNPSYEQPANATPIWSLAKPLPRVVRPGMVPTKAELLESRTKVELPAQNSQNAGLAVDPNQLEAGRIDPQLNLGNVAAQVKDSRVQRENAFVDKLLTGDNLTRRRSRSSRQSMSRPSFQGANFDTSDQPIGPEDRLEPVQEHISDGELSDHIPFPDLQDSSYPEDLHPLVQDLVEEEIHNNHTAWSVIRTHHREALAEALAVYIQLTIGFCADLSVAIGGSGDGNTTAWTFGLATMMAIYISGGISGAHLNPAITITLWFYRGFPKRKMPEYFLAQVIGAFCACLTAYGLYYSSIQQYLIKGSDVAVIGSFVTSQRDSWIDTATAFFNEFIGTLFLAVTVLALGDDQNAPPGAGMNALIIGLVIVCLSLTFSFQTGAALNPSRDFGPRLGLLALGYGTKLFTNPYWFYGPVVACTTGAFVGAFIYDFMIFTGGESPVNYPLERTERAMKKGTIKWKKRLHSLRGTNG
ncbi:hypothetical protein Golomagni_06268, partial [Golovinomyces magnicellulatus]